MINQQKSAPRPGNVYTDVFFATAMTNGPYTEVLYIFKDPNHPVFEKGPSEIRS